MNNLCRKYIFSFDADAVLQFDEDVMTKYHSHIAFELITPDICDSEPKERKENYEAENTPCNMKISTPLETFSTVNGLVDFALASNSSSLLELVYQDRNLFENTVALNASKQTTLFEFWMIWFYIYIYTYKSTSHFQRYLMWHIFGLYNFSKKQKLVEWETKYLVPSHFNFYCIIQ